MAARTDGLSLQAASRPQTRRLEAERDCAAPDAGTPFANVLDAEERATAKAQARAPDEARPSDPSPARREADPDTPAVDAPAERARRPPTQAARQRDATVEPGGEQDGDAADGEPLEDAVVATVLGLCSTPAEAAATGPAEASPPANGGPSVDWPVALPNLAAAAAPSPTPASDAEAGCATGFDVAGVAGGSFGGNGVLAPAARAMLIVAGAEAAAIDGAEAGATADASDSTPSLDAGSAAGLADPRATQRSAPPERVGGATPAPEIRSPLGTTAWADELGSRVTWMVERGEQVASLKLSPEHLGPLEVRIAVREGETSIWFGAAQADTRAALEQSLPRLREMLGASGLSLANAGVFSHTPRDPQRGFTAAALARAAQESGTDPQSGVVTTLTGRGLVDLYA